MGHDPDPAAAAEQLRSLIRDAHAAVKDLRAAIRDTRQLRDDLAAEFREAASAEIRALSNHLQAESNAYARELNERLIAARESIAGRLFEARIEFDEAADNFRVIFPGGGFVEDTPPPYPERMTPR